VKKLTVAKSKKVKTGSNLAESSKEACGSKRVVLPIIIIIIIIKSGRSLEKGGP
jgi:hypothetical protein